MKPSVCLRSTIATNNTITTKKRLPFHHIKTVYGKDISLQRQFFDEIGRQLNVQQLDDWYHVDFKSFVENGGGALLKSLYDNSLAKALKTVYPEHDWKRWRFENIKMEKLFWNKTDNQRAFMEWFASKNGIDSPQQWYDIDPQQLIADGGKFILQSHNGSLKDSLSSIYPEIEWKSSMFKRQQTWEDLTFQRQSFDALWTQLGITKYEDWYQKQASDIHECGNITSTILKQFYKDTLPLALQTIYPEFNWQIWRFTKVPKGFWKDKQNVLQYMTWFADQMGINRISDWQYILSEQFPSNLRKHYGGHVSLISSLYPDFFSPSTRGKSVPANRTKTQQLLHRIISRLFPGQEVQANYRHPSLMFQGSHREVEFDIFLPEKNLAVEYYGEQHYLWHFLYGSPAEQQKRDREKRKVCEEAGITLIEIPFWWDRTDASIQATLHWYRPDLVTLSGRGKPIPSTLFEARTRSKASAMKYFSMQMPEPAPWPAERDPAGWLVASWADGLRLFWDGEGKLYRKDGSHIKVPKKIQDLFVKMPLEVLIRQRQESLMDTTAQILSSDNDDGWTSLVFTAVDCPVLTNLPFEQRLSRIQSELGRVNSPLLNAASFVRCDGMSHLESLLRDGSSAPFFAGVIMKSPGGYYSEPESCYEFKNFDIKLALLQKVNDSSIVCQLKDGSLVTIQNVPVEIRQQPVNTVLSVKIDNNGSLSVFKIKSGLKWEETTDKPLAYRLTTGKGTPRCRCCKELIRDKSSLRLEVLGLFTAPTHETHQARFSYCLKPECLKQGLSPENNVGGVGIYKPAFDYRLGVLQNHKGQLPPVDPRVTWIPI